MLHPSTLQGKVTRIMPDGFGFLTEEGTNRQYVFSLKAIPDYRGESLRELNLRAGTHVKFTVEGDRVARLKILEDANPRPWILPNLGRAIR